MIFESLTVRNFRSIAQATLPMGPITVLVGPNNSGKSSLLRSLYTLQQQLRPMGDVRLGATECTVELQCVGLPPLKLGTGDDIPEDFAGGRLRAAGKAGSDPTLSMSTPGVDGQGSSTLLQRPPASEPHNLIYPVLSWRRTQPSQQQVTSTSARMIQESDTNLVARVADLQGSLPQAREFARLCKSVIGLELEVVAQEHGQILGHRIDMATTIPLENMGSGLYSSLSLLAGMAVARRKLFLVEEPEAELHPRALKLLLDEILDSSVRNGNQFVVTTHSSIVVGRLGAAPNAVLIEASAGVGEMDGNSVPLSRYEVISTPDRRIAVLRTLGYELQDLDMASAWLILEESSAEALVGWLIAWFVPELATVRTISARGTGRVRELFANLREMFLYAHLESQYQGKAWVLVDGDESGCKVATELRSNFPSWESSHFHTWSQADIERYYPERFEADVSRVLGLKGSEKWAQKAVLTAQVKSWILANPEVARGEFQESASEILAKLREIASALRPLVVVS